jgi:Trypsin-like peptidase domain
LRNRYASEQLLFSTVRIEVQTRQGNQGTGTGFFFEYKLSDGRVLPLIVTNRHVIQDSAKGIFYLHEAIETEGKFVPSGQFFPVQLDNFDSFWIGHPNDVDLCAMLFQPIREQANKIGKRVYTVSLDNSLIWPDDQLCNLSAVEDIVMVGYPIGLWDEINNLPIFRRGITATHPSVDFKGKKEFLIDVAAFPGSSGSPVLLLNASGIYYDKKQNTNIIGHRVVFLGVLHAGPQMTTQGEIVIRDIPTNRQVFTQIPLMINLGYVIRASEVLNLSQYITDLLKAKGML